MSLYKRGKIWWVRFTDPNGNEVRQSAKTSVRKEAQEYEIKLKSACWRRHQLGEQPARRWQEAVELWFEVKTESGKATLNDDALHLRWLHAHLFDRHLHEIDKETIDAIRKARKSDGVSNATVNRMLEVLRGILRMCVEQEWLHKAPRVAMLPLAEPRIRWLTYQEEERLFRELPEHLAEMARFSLATGLRQSNVTGLEWSQVDTVRKCAWIHADQSKSRKAIAVPLNSDAMQTLERQTGKHDARVFTYFGKPVTKANTKAWRQALVRAGISNFRWHDLRHTWASRHVMSGTSLHVLKELGGWSDYEMVLRYAHLAPEHLAQHAERIVVVGTKSGTVEKEAA